MKTIKQILKELQNGPFGFDLTKFEQGSDEWRMARLGLLTASEASDILAGKTTETKKSYINKKVAEICTGTFEEVTSKAMAWGKEYEVLAVSSMEFKLGDCSKVPMILGKSGREACSPDALFGDRGGEVKCPFNSAHHIAFLTDGKIKPEYVKQCQFSMRIAECDKWEFGSYDKRVSAMPFSSVTIERDEEIQKELEDSVQEVIFEIDKKLKMIGVKFGDQWKQQIKQAA